MLGENSMLEFLKSLILDKQRHMIHKCTQMLSLWIFWTLGFRVIWRITYSTFSLKNHKTIYSSAYQNIAWSHQYLIDMNIKTNEMWKCTF